MNFKIVFLFLISCTLTFAQKGTVTGTLTDKDMNNEPLPFANAFLKGTPSGTTTDENGVYEFSAEPGNYILSLSFLGYETIEVSIVVKANETITVNKALTAGGGFMLSDVVVETTTSKERESALLIDQKISVDIKQSIGAQEMSRKGISDVSSAVTKTTGITKQEGSGNIFVRGLGDRYNSSTMNGLPIPSNNPEKKNINLDIFSTDILEYVSIDKVYNSKLYGDFAGGNIDIISKDFSGKQYIKLDVESKINSNAISENNFTLQNGPSGSGFTTYAIPNNPLTEYNYNSLGLDKKSPIASSFGISGGKSFQVGEVSRLNFFATASFSNQYSAIADGSAKGGVNEAGVINKDFEEFVSLGYTTNTTLMGNLGYKINSSNKINFNSVYVNSSSQTKEEYSGLIVDIANDGNGLIRRSTYVKNNLFINQLIGEHKFNERTKLNWAAALNKVQGDMPDRTQNIFRKETNGYVLSNISAPDNHRYFQYLEENETVGNASLEYKFDKKEFIYKGKFTFGYNGRYKTRDFEATQFNFKSNTGFTNTIVDPDNLDAFYNQENLSNGYFSIATFRGNSQVSNALAPQTYDGELLIHGAFLNTEYKFEKLTALVGLRGEYIFQSVKWNTQLEPSGGKDELEKIAFLPSLTMKYELNEKQNLRLGFSKTYTLPQFKERALFVYEEVTEVKVGNPDLYASDDYNFDLKWELFPKNEEVVSVTGFGKYILNPMNEVTISSSTNDISFINTGDFGYVAGAEVELRKLLFEVEGTNSQKLSGGLNASYLYSNQELNTLKVIKETDYNVVFTNEEGKFTGASDLLLNADVTFITEWNEKESNFSSTIAYAYFSDRVYAIGTNGRGDLVDKAFGSLDFVAKSKLTKNLGVNFIARNLLDPTINRVQENSSGDINVLTYKKGLNFNLSISYQF
ncbi:TonB-dependent receptor [Flavobacterium sp.]|uniref:TonB-dependent receptor n=1 Tax=Flavobacterium sp. TaxID=239 RepID=UPI00262A9802|nr:TonB-dependent receptor [Flavobacterium sp.]MDD2985416.1 carboxypeptidase-like regulatory domain-containing protein [Flavobacterium sp.]